MAAAHCQSPGAYELQGLQSQDHKSFYTIVRSCQLVVIQLLHQIVLVFVFLIMTWIRVYKLTMLEVGPC